jgi:hypothetical protein
VTRALFIGAAVVAVGAVAVVYARWAGRRLTRGIEGMDRRARQREDEDRREGN